jgi:hypothetical protein
MAEVRSCAIEFRDTIPQGKWGGQIALYDATTDSRGVVVSLERRIIEGREHLPPLVKLEQFEACVRSWRFGEQGRCGVALLGGTVFESEWVVEVRKNGRTFRLHLRVAKLAGFGVSSVVASGECPIISASNAIASPSSAAVFSGIVRQVQDPDTVQVVTFDVDRVWKGALPRRVELYQVNVSEAIKFSPGVRYLIVAYRETDSKREPFRTSPPAGMLGINVCASRSFEEAERYGDLRDLGPGRLPD